MKPFIEILDQLLIEINTSINEKVSGTSFLDILKFQLIEKLKLLDQKIIEELLNTLVNEKSYERGYNLGERSITYKIDYFAKSISRIKFNTENNFLSIILDGAKKISIFEKNIKNKSIQVILTKNMGIVISKNTVISTEITKKSIVLTFLNN